MLNLSKKVSTISPSKTLAITSLAKSLKKQGKNVISFGAGEPDFDTFDTIKDAAKKAIDEGFTKYTPESGMPELKKAISDKLASENGLKYDPSQIIVSCGAKHSLYNVIQAITNPGDEIIVIAPYWLSYPEMIKLADAKVVVADAGPGKGYKATADIIEKFVTDKTKALILNSPSNPAGIIYSKEELRAIADLAVKKQFYVISDEIYEKLIYDGLEHVSIGALGDDIFRNTITVNGVSKAYSMTGWRIGYLGASSEITKACSALQGHSTSNPSSISQKAALAALTMGNAEIDAKRKEFEARRDIILKLLDGIPAISYIRPNGAFYVYCDISRTGMKAETFAGKLLEEKLVAVIPCESFGSDRHIRLSFAMEIEKIKEGLERIKTWVKQ